MNYMIPEDMEQYLSFYGYHFNKKLCDFAVENMKKEDETTKVPKPLKPMTMDELKSLAEKHKLDIRQNDWYDALYLANMVKADFWGSAIEDEEHLIRYIEDVICDVDGYEGLVLSRFLADCTAKGIVIFWDLML